VGDAVPGAIASTRPRRRGLTAKGTGVGSPCPGVAPAGLEAQREPSVVMLLEPFTRERGAGDVAAEPLKASPVARGNGDFGVQAHTAVPGGAFGGFGIGSRLSDVSRLDAIAEASRGGRRWKCVSAWMRRRAERAAVRRARARLHRQRGPRCAASVAA
jgi:hypothetical protein